jgi:hypothetical protein
MEGTPAQPSGDVRGRAPRWRRWLRRALRLSLVLAIVCLLALHVLPFLTNTRAVRGLVAGEVSARLNGASVELAVLRVAPLRGRLLLLEGLAIAPPGRADPPVIELQHLSCDWSPAALLQGRLHIDRVSVLAPALHLRQDDEGWNILAIRPPPREPTEYRVPELPLAVQVDVVRVRGARIDVSAAGALAADIGLIDADGSARFSRELDGAARVTLRVAGLSAGRGPAAISLPEGLTVDLGLDGRDGVMEVDAAAEAGGVLAGVAGIARLGPIAASVRGRAELDLASVELPSVELVAVAPGLLHGHFAGSVVGGPQYRLSARSAARADLAALSDLLRLETPLTIGMSGTVGSEATLEGVAGASPVSGLRVRIEHRAWAQDASFRLEATKGPADLAGGVSGVAATACHEVAVRTADRLVASAFVDASGSLALAEARYGEMLQCALSGVHWSGFADALFPAVVADVQAAARVHEARIVAPGRGEAALPFSARLALRGGLQGPAGAWFSLRRLAGRVGDVCPEFWLAAEAARRSGRLSATGGAVLDLGAAARLLDGLADELQSLVGEVSIAGGAGVALELAGHPAEQSLALVTRAEARAERAGLTRRGPGVALTDARGFAAVSSSVCPGVRIHDLSLAASGAAAGITADLPGLASLATGRCEGTVTGASARADLDRARMHVAASATDVEAVLAPTGVETRRIGPMAAEFSGDAIASPLAADLDVSNLVAEAPGLAIVRVPRCRLLGLGVDECEAEGALWLPDLGALWAMGRPWLPAAVAKRAPVLAGELSASASAEGRLPLIGDVLGAVLSGDSPLARLELFPLARFVGRELSVRLESELRVGQLSAGLDLVEGLRLEVPALRAEGRAGYGDGNGQAEATVRVPVLSLGPSFAVPAAIVVDVGARLADLDRLTVEATRVDAMGGLLEATGTVDIRGIHRLAGVPMPADILSSLDVRARSSGKLQPDRLRFLPGLTALGAASWEGGAELSAGRSLVVEARPEFRGLAVGFGELFGLQGLDGGVSFAKKWDIRRVSQRGAGLTRELGAPGHSRTGVGVRQELAGLADGLGALVPPPDSVRLGALSALGFRLVEGGQVDLAADGARIDVPRILLSVLGGTVSAGCHFGQGPEGREFGARGEFVDVDCRYLLPAQLRNFQGGSSVSGSFAVTLVLAGPEEFARSPIRDISGRLDLTRIGPRALDRALLALDPAGENPAIVRARLALKVGGPERVRARLDRGFVSAEIDLQGLPVGWLSRYQVPRFSVAQVLGSHLVTSALARAAPLLLLLDIADADAIELPPDGSVRFVRDAQYPVAAAPGS